MDRVGSSTLKYLIIGILAYFILLSLPILIFTEDKIYNEAGLLLGIIMGIFMAIHMEMMIRKSMYMEKHQSAFFVSNSLLRLLLIGGVIIIVAWTRWISPYTLLLGLFGLKISAYIQPYFIDKLLNNKEGR